MGNTCTKARSEDGKTISDPGQLGANSDINSDENELMLKTTSNYEDTVDDHGQANPNRNADENIEENELTSMLKCMHHRIDQLIDVKELMHREMMKGLSKDTHNTADVKMYPTYVRATPDGTESGDFLALDIGGTNLRVLYVHISDKVVKQIAETRHEIKDLKKVTGIQLFDYVAERLAEFMEKNGLKEKTLPLGFTFSFPYVQKGLTSATLTAWSKDFEVSGVEGEDVYVLLQEAIKRRGDISVNVLAVINDTTGTLMSCAFEHHDCVAGLILGTGTNACYIEKLENVDIWDGDTLPPQQIIINTEWGAFGDRDADGNGGVLEHLITEYDDEINRSTVNDGKHIFEKMTSGMYLGEIVRLILVKLTKAGVIFNGNITDDLETKWIFKTKYISYIEEDTSVNNEACKSIFKKFGLEIKDEDCEKVKTVCSAVSSRAAKLLSAGIAAIVCQVGRKEVICGVDGSLYKYHPNIKTIMAETTKLLAPFMTVQYVESSDGSGRGAAIVAAVAQRLKK
ncbi:hexokinase-4-like [Saccoglossus kowalevskii]|uniref:Phosphotransferase n=1 Tax=Saccoglossus kowalevskii TaxID=10224 RepID=A0ABM0GQ10_SACKO|nr:PREDICTED: hexokinase-2-like [Saccoglossus kowalevskii]